MATHPAPALTRAGIPACHTGGTRGGSRRVARAMTRSRCPG
ncbi:hypothetical protein [Streptomyces globosus]